MNNKLIAAALCTSVSLVALPASADQASDLAELKAQMTQMQREYAARMAILEKRLSKAEAEAKTAQTKAVIASKSASAAQNSSKTAAEAAVAAKKSAAAVPPTPPVQPPRSSLPHRRRNKRHRWSCRHRHRRPLQLRTIPSILGLPQC